MQRQKITNCFSPPPLSENSDLSKKFHVSEIHRVIYTLLGCLFLCLFVSNKRENRWTDWAQILCGSSHIPWKSFKKIKILKISKICLQQNSIFIKFENPRKFYIKNFLFLLYNVFKSARKKKMKSANFFVIVLYCTKRKCS